jgi:sarcosine oxidase subunit gamma
MPDGETRVSALAAGYRVGSFGAAAAGPGVVLRERRPLAIVQIATWPRQSPAAQAAASGVLGGASLPTAPNTSTTAGATAVLSIGPERWLVVAPERASDDLAAALASALGGALAAVTDLSHSRTVLRLTGPRTPELLAKGCALDLHRSKFPVGTCAQGLLAPFGVLIHAVDETPSFDLYVARSYALALWEWLGESTAEYGYRVEAPLTG